MIIILKELFTVTHIRERPYAYSGTLLRIFGNGLYLVQQTGSFLRDFPLQYPIVYPYSIQYLIPNNNNKYLIPQRKNSISIFAYLLTHPHYYFFFAIKKYRDSIPGISVFTSVSFLQFLNVHFYILHWSFRVIHHYKNNLILHLSAFYLLFLCILLLKYIRPR